MKQYKIIAGEASIQGSKSWLSFRTGKLGASDASTIMGENPYETPSQFYDRFMLGESKPKTPAMERGTRLEPLARKWLNDKIGTNYEPVVIQSRVYPGLIASLDGYFEDAEGNPFIVEIKCGGEKNHMIAVNGKVPGHYRAQLQHQMMLTGVDQMLYVSFDGESGVILEVKKDEIYQKKLIYSELAFLDAVTNFTPPSSSKEDWVLESSLHLSTIAREYSELSMNIVQLTEKLELLKNELIASCAHPKTMIGSLKIQQVNGRTTTDYSRYIKDHNIEIPESYKKESSQGWRINQIT